MNIANFKGHVCALQGTMQTVRILPPEFSEISPVPLDHHVQRDALFNGEDIKNDPSILISDS